MGDSPKLLQHTLYTTHCQSAAAVAQAKAHVTGVSCACMTAAATAGAHHYEAAKTAAAVSSMRCSADC
jgi:hypothetical protein